LSLPHKARPHDDPRPEYYYRRRLAGSELLPAIGAGIAIGLLAFYATQLFMQRTPLVPTARGRRRFVPTPGVLAVEGDDSD
jgi:hypothetical protein